MKKWKFGLALTALSMTSAYANMSTAMESAGMLQAILVNPLIAILEAILLTRLGKVSFVSAFFVMLIANYLSFAMGWTLNRPLSSAIGYPFYLLLGATSWYWTVALAAATSLALVGMYALTVAAETVLARSILNSWRNALRTTAIVNLVSYLALIGYYFYWSDLDFLRLPHQPNAAFVQTEPATIYFLDRQRRLCAISPRGGAIEVLDDAPSWLGDPIVRVMFPLWMFYCTESDRWVLERRGCNFKVFLYPPYLPKDLKSGSNSQESYSVSYPDWRREASPYQVKLERLDGIVVQKHGKEHLRLRANLPFGVDPGQHRGAFLAVSPSVLPGEYLVYEFAGRVMITHIPTRRTAKLADGYTPIAILTKSRRLSQQ
ncbi:MAG: hypothetical protein N2651_09115 [Fimbriimonadales bacterium]|nr:hypothetical protein [Fimbriimonadales bacterium]